MPDDYITLRVNVRTRTMDELREEALRETEDSGRYVYVSDLVRGSIADLLRRRKRDREAGATPMRVLLGGQAARDEG